MKSSDLRPVFVVSTGRAGSKMIARVLARHSCIFAIHEPKPHLNAEALARWRGSHNRERLQRSIQGKRSDFIEQVQWNGLKYLESSHFCSHLISDLHYLYDARFIYLYRDGRDFVRSGLEREWWYTEKRKNSNPLKRMAGRWLRRKYFLGTGFGWEDHRLDPPKRMDSRLEKITWLWVEINKRIILALEEIGEEAYIEIKLEEIGDDKIKKLLNFMSLNVKKDVLKEMHQLCINKPNKTKDRSVDSFEKWNPEDQNVFWEIAGGMMVDLGYVG